MDLTVFDVFSESTYTFLKISRGGVYGNIVENKYESTGVFDINEGMITSNNQESYQSDSLAYIHPYESFIQEITVEGRIMLVGNGIKLENRYYEIVGFGVGRNQDTLEIEHYELTLQAADFSDYIEGS